MTVLKSTFSFIFSKINIIISSRLDLYSYHVFISICFSDEKQVKRFAPTVSITLQIQTEVCEMDEIINN